MTTGCEFYRDGLIDLAAGRLPRERRERLEAHLAACEACRQERDVISMVRSAPPVPPPGLEVRIQGALRADVATVRPAGGAPRARVGQRRAGGWRPWALPLAAAAALAAVWVGVESGGPGAQPDAGAGVELEVEVEDFQPYGAIPAGGGVVAGDPLLSELSVEELERLLEEMRR